MKKYIYIILLIVSVQITNAQTLPPRMVEKISDSIFEIEGGNNTKFPYGIKSLDTHGDKLLARAICKNTIINNYKRYHKLSAADKAKYHCYLDFLANRYTPPSVDFQGNINWKKNIHILVGDVK